MANKTARLGDLATYINGYAFKPADWGETGLPIIRIQDLTGNSYQLNRYDGEYPERIEVNDGDVLISWSASLGVYVWQRGKALLNQHIFKVVFDKLPVNKDYFVFAVEHKLAEMESKTHGATMKHIVKKDFDGTTIPYPPIEKQAEIADHLRRITSLIDRQTEQLLLLDQLVKSRFIELFGDADRFEAAPLDDNVEEMFIGPFGSSLKNECFVAADQGYCMVYEQKHAIKKTMEVDTRYIDEKKYKELRRFTVQGGDIIVSCRGTIGETFIIPDGAPFGIMHPSIMKIRLKAPAYNRVFFNHLLQTVLERHEAEANGSGVKMAITATALGKEHFILPPMELQEQFAAFVEQTDKSKLAVQKGLQELEILKKSLMQQYFG